MQFVQTKIAASDPESLATFYVEALQCSIRRQLTALGDGARNGVGASEGEIQILVLGLPGIEEGPDLELITGTGRDPGSAMLTFYVEDVASAADRVIGAGGAFRGEITEFEAPNGATFRFVFMTDPEGNVIDLFQAVG